MWSCQIAWSVLHFTATYLSRKGRIEARHCLLQISGMVLDIWDAKVWHFNYLNPRSWNSELINFNTGGEGFLQWDRIWHAAAGDCRRQASPSRVLQLYTSLHWACCAFGSGACWVPQMAVHHHKRISSEASTHLRQNALEFELWSTQKDTLCKISQKSQFQEWVCEFGQD